MQTALCISCITNYNFDLGVVLLTSKERRGAPVHSDATNASLKLLLEDAFLQQEDEHLNSWVDPATSTWPATVIKTAFAYAQGNGLASWVRHINVGTGNVVRTERLIEQYNAMNSSGSSSNQMLNDVRPHTHQNGRKWVQRWRRKHSAYVGSFNVRDPIDVDEIRQKVRLQVPSGWKMGYISVWEMRYCCCVWGRFFRNHRTDPPSTPGRLA